MKRMTCTLMLLASVTAAEVAVGEVRLPSFLTDYYGPAFNNSGRPLIFVSQRGTNGITQCIYTTDDRKELLSVENVNCDGPACIAGFNNVLGHLNQVIATNKGAFMEITETEAHAEMILTNVTQTVLVFVLPHSVHIWTHSAAPTSSERSGPGFQEVRALANRQRFDEAFREGNVSLGKWRASIHDYARELLKSGRKGEALVVFENLLATSPFDYEAHLEFTENTADSLAATNSAKVVFKNAEDPGQISRAANFIGVDSPTSDKIPLLATDETGLELVLIPIPPCNPWLLDEAAKMYERITDIPVKIRRLDKEWTWGVPERIARQRDVQGILVRLAKQNIDFTNWTRDRYFEALSGAAKSEDALSKYWVNDLVGKIKAEPGQYRADSYLEALSRLLKPHRSKDVRTMYVGITEANIYGGDNNFVFSVATTDAESHAGLMSYHMMLGKTLHAAFDSRQRLVERIAKELVPASLKQLRIPRSTDPTCPYSYSSGVERLDQKTLTLSDEVKQALNRLKTATSGSSGP